MIIHSSRKKIFIVALAALALVAGGLGAAYAEVLDPTTIPKYQTPLLIPPVMPKAGNVPNPGGPSADYYEIAVRQFAQQILPPSLPDTTVWGYGAVAVQGNSPFLNFFNAPSLTIEAQFGRPVRVKWINQLREDPNDPESNFLPHLLTVDPTLHWANPPGGTAGRDSRPDFTGQPTPDPYTGPVPLVTHVHGAVGVGDESDGYAEAWYLPQAGNIPAGFATEGTWYEFFEGKATAAGYGPWEPGSATFQYPNNNRPSTIWYHDHTLGMTRLNVYAGPAGFYLIRGGPNDDRVLDNRKGGNAPAILPGPAPQANDPFPPPPGKKYYEIPIAIQDRSFNDDGSLFYPTTRADFDNANPFIPDGPFSPYWNPEVFGNTIMVNGNTWPFLTVEQKRYRFRFLNGCQSRFLILDFSEIINPDPDNPNIHGEVWQIGNEGGFLAQAVNLNDLVGDNGPNRLPMGLAERADIIVDFTKVPVGNYVLKNVGPDEPYGGGVPGTDFPIANPSTTGQVLEFRVVAATNPPDNTTPGANIVLPLVTPLPTNIAATRHLALLEKMAPFNGDEGPVEALLGTIADDPDEGPAQWTQQLWMQPVTENPALGATEVWELYNATGDAHPIHIHEVVFEVLNRQAIIVNDVNETVEVDDTSAPTGPEPWETGFKDTVTAFPGQVTRVKAQFNTPGQFVWHCHIVEHEDNEMMRPYRIGPAQPGQPDATM
jgi:spore coat protein A, manganese oxidase